MFKVLLRIGPFLKLSNPEALKVIYINILNFLGLFFAIL